MYKEILKNIYLIFFRIIFNCFSVFKCENRVVFIASFNGNCEFVANKVKNLSGNKIIFICTDKVFEKRKSLMADIVIKTNLDPLYNLKAIFYLATSKYIFIDNYYSYLSQTSFKSDVICTQLWHAAGAIKKFGLSDKNLTRYNSSIKRYKSVYNRFDNVVVGSDNMEKIFTSAFDISKKRIIKTGVPRTDLFFNGDKQERVKKHIYDAHPGWKRKKVILYAPTYRDNELENIQLRINLDLFSELIDDQYLLLLKLHPAIKNGVEINGDGNIENVTDSYEINELLLISDLLITDYSSIPFEYSLLNRPMVFFTYDLEDYKRTKGIWGDFENSIPGPIVRSTVELCETINEAKWDLNKINEFKMEWNKYSKGNSSENLVKHIFKLDDSTIKEKNKDYLISQ